MTQSLSTSRHNVLGKLCGLLILLATLFGMSIAPAQAASLIASDAAELIAAINTANGNGEADTITLTANINIDCGTGTFSANGTNALPSITSQITIISAGLSIARTGTTDCRILHVAAAGNLTLIGVTISSGRATGSFPANLGGGIYNLGTTTLTNSTISSNSATGLGGNGGGIYNDDTITITNSTISNNSATGSFGAGGGIINRSTATITNSTISNNSATAGGGIYNQATLTITNSTISNNSATGSPETGGGIYSAGSMVTLTNSTIANNSAPGGGGGIWREGGTVTVNHSIVAGNTGGGSIFNCAGMIGGSNNLANGGGCATGFGTIATSNYTALSNTGGPTRMHVLVTGINPAIDPTTAGSTATDQRGVPAQGNRDIGAFELASSPPTYPTVQFASAGVTYAESDGTVSITLNVTGAANFAGIAEVYVADSSTGTATSGTDYTAFPLTTVTIDCSSGCPASVTVPLSITNDGVTEPDETVNLQIGATNGFATIGTQNTFTATIEDDDSIPAIGVSKVALVSGTGPWTVTMALRIENIGNVPLAFVQVTDDLAAVFGTAGTDWVSPPGLSIGAPNLTVAANAGYNGDTNTNLLQPGAALNPGQAINATITVTVNTAGSYSNQAEATANSGAVTDLSDDGTNPDTDGDNNANEAGENDPTPINLTTSGGGTTGGAGFTASSTTSPGALLRLIGLQVASSANGELVAQPGAEAKWTYTLRNISGRTLNDVVATITYPDDDMEGLSAASSRGVNGTFRKGSLIAEYALGSLQADETVTLTINTRLPNRAAVYSGTLSARAEGVASSDGATLTLLAVQNLPQTGETPWWRDAALLLIGVLGLGALTAARLRLR